MEPERAGDEETLRERESETPRDKGKETNTNPKYDTVQFNNEAMIRKVMDRQTPQVRQRKTMRGEINKEGDRESG